MDYSWNLSKLVKLKYSFIDNVKNSRTIQEKQFYENNLIILDEILLNSFLEESKLVDSGKSLNELYEQLKDECKNLELKDLSNLSDIKRNIVSKISILDNIATSSLSNEYNIESSVDTLGKYIKNTYDDSHYQNFYDLYLNRSDILQLGAYHANPVTYIIDYLSRKEYYVLIPNTKDFKMFSALAHETGHIYRLTNNPYYIDDEELLEEFESYFYEVKGLIYCIDNNIEVNNAKNLLKYLINEVEKYVHLYNMIINNDIFKCKNYIELKKIIDSYHLLENNVFKNMEDVIDAIYHIYSKSLFKYIYSLICVLGILGDKKEKDIYKEIINNLGLIDVLDHKSIFGKSFDELFCNYVDIRKKIKRF